MRVPIDFMTILNERIRDRPAGQPASAESVERNLRLAVKAAAIESLKALRIARETPADAAKPRPKSHSRE